MGNHKMRVVGFFLVIFELLKLSLTEKIEGDVVAGLISIDQPKAGDYAATDGEKGKGKALSIRATPKKTDFRPTKCVAKAPDGTKYEMKPGKTYKGGKIKCLCDVVVDLLPHECGIVIVDYCWNKSFHGKWTLDECNANGDCLSKEVEKSEHESGCVYHHIPVDGQWGEWGSWAEECEGEHQKRTRKCDSPAPSQHPRGKDCVGPSQDLRPCPPKDCPSAEWELHGEFCYRFVDKDLSWIDAWHHCKNEEDAHLASLHSHEENCILSGLGKAGTRFPFWLDGRFIEEGTDDKGKKWI